MAALSLMSNQAAAVQTLLSQLVENDAPIPAEIWPLALGYWLLIFLFIAVTAWFSWRYKKNTSWRNAKKKLAEIKTMNDGDAQSTALHVLLRWALTHNSSHLKRLTSEEFAETVMKGLNLNEAPSWLNAHYQAINNAGDINWLEAAQLLKLWCKGSNR